MEAHSYRKIRDFLLSGKLPKKFSSTKSNFIAETKRYKLNSLGNLMRNSKIVLLKSDLKVIFKECHGVGHSGRKKTWDKINRRYYFRGGEKWIRKQVRNCVACSHKGSLIWPSFKTPLRPIKVTPKAFWRIHVDLLGPIHPTSKNGNKYIALAVCPLTKFVECAAKKQFLFIYILY